MTDCLAGCHLKLKRAGHHLEAINTAARNYIEVDLTGKSDQVQLKSTNEWQWLVWGEVPPPDPMIGVILGDFVHNVRSALDQAVWALVSANGGTPGRHTHFPIKDTETQWRDDIVERPAKRGEAPTEGLSLQAVELVRHFQPFPDGRRPGPYDVLRKLHRMSNEDKHRTLHGMAVTPTTGIHLVFTPLGYVRTESIKYPNPRPPVQSGAKIAKIKLVIEPSEAQVDVRMNQIAGFGVGFFAGSVEVARDFNLPEILKIAKQIVYAAGRLPEVSGR